MTLVTFMLCAQMEATAFAAGQDVGVINGLVDNSIAQKAVDKNVNAFTEVFRKPFAKWLSRSRKYIGMMKRILTEHNVPADMIFLSMIESGFSPYAYSPAKAVGPWQFVDSTARRYGLKIDKWVDERRDPEKSTRAAALYLNDLHKMFGSWGLAMAAYNAGEGAVKRALEHVNGNDYWALYQTNRIAQETKDYVPRIIAAKYISMDPAAHGFTDIQYEKKTPYDQVVLWSPVDLDVAAKCAGTDVQTIRKLNPELKRWCTPPNVRNYILKIPQGTLVTFLDNLSKLPAQDRMSPQRIYSSRRGDTLRRIAFRFDLSARLLADLNGLRSIGRRLRPGTRITLPPAGKSQYLIARS